MQKRRNKVLSFVVFAFIFLCSQVNYAQFDIPPVPSKAQQTSVYDYAQILSSQQSKALEERLLTYSKETSTQIVVITIPSLEGESIGILGPKWGQTWGIGQKDKGNGVLILLAAKERQIGIYPGYGAEVQITAGQGGELIRNRIIPEFKKGDYYAGLNEGVTGIMEMLAGTYQADKDTRMEGDNELGGLLCVFAIIALIIGTIVFKNKNNNGGGRGGNGSHRGFLDDLASMVILSNLGRSSGGGGFGGGGSFGGGGGFGGGFGGGGFSGGGSSGSW
ncbi:TPM domain-containing protein [Myroides sp. NP-2]|uniref:TPM domain-containing protein n=1 Tax=Myroides sp. NP-2 TaxID=2759945 RepID=UPI0015FE323C|nr:TPM domain-containing protein [Myroides sp. NP-2]MBB1150039.1 TPM domain-containing protein [Myroides sp. NP-2]